MVRMKVKLVETQEHIYVLQQVQSEENSQGFNLPGRVEISVPDIALREQFDKDREYWLTLDAVNAAPVVPGSGRPTTDAPKSTTDLPKTEHHTADHSRGAKK